MNSNKSIESFTQQLKKLTDRKERSYKFLKIDFEKTLQNCFV